MMKMHTEEAKGNHSIVSLFLLIMCLSALLFMGCEGNNTKENNAGFSNEDWLKTLPTDYLEYVNNTKSANDLVTREYALNDLIDYFGAYGTSIEGGGFFVLPKNVTIDEANKVFKIECIRHNDNESHYGFFTVYKVKEGGRYYVLWSQDASSYTALEAVYINQLRDIDDFNSLKPGESTLSDVIKIDTSIYYSFFYSSKSFSCSLLSDGTLLIINYVPGGPLENQIIKSIEITETGPAFLLNIYKYDLSLG